MKKEDKTDDAFGKCESMWRILYDVRKTTGIKTKTYIKRQAQKQYSEINGQNKQNSHARFLQSQNEKD